MRQPVLLQNIQCVVANCFSSLRYRNLLIHTGLCAIKTSEANAEVQSCACGSNESGL